MNNAMRTSAVLGILLLLLLASVGCASQKSVDDLSNTWRKLHVKYRQDWSKQRLKILVKLLPRIKIRLFWRKPQQTQLKTQTGLQGCGGMGV